MFAALVMLLQWEGFLFLQLNALAGASRDCKRLNHLRTNWIMVRRPFVYHRLDLRETQFFKTMSQSQGSRVFGSREQTIRPPVVESEFAVGGQGCPNIKLFDEGSREGRHGV